jgi:hypothetical protein
VTVPTLSPEAIRAPLPERTIRLGWIFLTLGVVLLGIAYMINSQGGAFDILVMFLFVASLAVGGVFLVALEYIIGAVWSVPIRRVNEFLAALTVVTPFVAIPLFFNLHDLFHWAHTDAVAADVVLASKSPYLNVPFFVIRFLVISAIWIFFYVVFTRNSTRQDTSRDSRLTTWNTRLAALFLPIFAVTVSVVAIDWAMSLEPHWYSTIFGVYYFSGTVLAAVSATTLIVVLLQDGGRLPWLRRDHLYSLGALMFAFLNFWAYIAFSQFLLIWYANLPEETFWFIKRWEHSWQYVSVLLIIVHFAVPYFGLLSQDSKMNPSRLKFMAAWILVAHLLDMYWLVMPTHGQSVMAGWGVLAIPLVVTGGIILLFSYKMRRNNLIPVGDPKLERGLNFRL